MPRDGTETRARIMDVAEGLILEQGYAATSVDTIVAGAGVTKGAFFHHFPAKVKLADQLWSTFEGAFILSKTLGSAGAVAAQLRQYRNYLELLFDGDARG